MNSVATVQLQTASQDVRNALADVARNLGTMDRFELVTGARYAMEEKAGNAPPPNAEDRDALGPHFFRGRELVLTLSS